jgi:hypothetical protein
VTGTSAQASPNTGYLADNASKVTITLPSNAAIGDIVMVSGAGLGGWQVAQSAGQQVHVGFENANWQVAAQSSSNVACSSDCSTVLAVSNAALLVSIDGGVTFNSTSAPTEEWSAIAISPNGTQMAAAQDNGPIYVSSNRGASWTATGTMSSQWQSVALTDSGRIVLAGYNDSVYLSTDDGASWTAASLGPGFWLSVAISADGNTLAAAGDGTVIYTSSDGGGTWTARNTSTGVWIHIYMSSDGSKLTAFTEGSNQISMSIDSGVTWNTATAPVAAGSFVEASADGTKLVVGEQPGISQNSKVYVSSDSGASWIPVAALSNIRGGACSADGTKLFAIAQSYDVLSFATSVTTLGSGGSIAGWQYQTVELQYFGSGLFSVMGNQPGSLMVQ